MKSKIQMLIGIVIIIMIPFITLLVISLFMTDRMSLYTSWKINLPKANEIDVVYQYEGRDGEDLEIWHYEKEKLEEIVNAGFEFIDNQSRTFIYERINHYYELLDNNEKELFNDNVNIEMLLIEKNYYMYKEKKDSSWILLILDYEHNSVFILRNIY